jgi:hypothetical protein
MKSIGLACALGSGWCAHATEAQAPPSEPTATLQWVRGPGAEDCADARDVSARVENKLQRPAFGDLRAARLLVEGRAEKTAGGYRAELRTFDAQGKLLGSREVLSEEASCARLSETVAVVLAVMLDPEAALAAPAAVDPTPPVKDPAPVCEAPPPPAPPPPPPKARPARDVSAFTRMAYGHLPAAIWGLGAALELPFKRFGGARVEGVGFLQRELDLDANPQVGAHLRVLYAGLQYCPLFEPYGRTRFSLCSGAEGGVIQSRSVGLGARGRDSVSPLINATASARLAVRLAGTFSFYAGAGLSVPLTRTLFEAPLQGGQKAELFEQGALAGEVDLGLGSRF